MIETIQENRAQGRSHRRWFSDEYFDLIVWQDADNDDILRFELCYGKNRDEHAFVWNQQSGHSHFKVDDGEDVSGKHKMSPIFMADGYFDRATITAKFLEAGKGIDQKISQFVYNKLKDYDEDHERNE